MEGVSGEDNARTEFMLWLMESNRRQRRAAGFKGSLPAAVMQVKAAQLHAPNYGQSRVKDKYGRPKE